MIQDYIRGAMRRAAYKILPDDASYFGEIPGFQGVWANNATLEECRTELEEVLEDWLELRTQNMSQCSVIPAQAGIHRHWEFSLDPRLRGDDEFRKNTP